ncbi:hypothetical protein [Erysipelothrix sp. HDW6C]|uniref:hypothetical protein n=1 Tax=Erysipelothrix sp. HDW6C TaxID=2714930 RepID=UPI001F0CF191|nr:hypothetical protein [Erysipelothrix sp. HDW6C]
MRSTLMLDSGYMWCVNLVAVGLATYFTPWGIIGLYLVGQSTDIFKMMVAFRFVRKEKWLTNLAAEETPIDLEFELT